MVEQRPPGNRDERLWRGLGQRAHAQAETGGEDHGFGGRNRHLGWRLEP
jgi:hypothetical protein